eukprot:CAMPEP_0194478132 /NCGR_PEP_ID=MMETSP0253-20130528/1694_1 /TAXON_ID=2966 /ORGANISM="Noctiluca scintillans" /LENGTH=98 /DNA_ID=CAMNT_0039317195 /DNA_START=45 /DNA_END=338 /DNA_ORIENTATION=-
MIRLVIILLLANAGHFASGEPLIPGHQRKLGSSSGKGGSGKSGGPPLPDPKPAGPPKGPVSLRGGTPPPGPPLGGSGKGGLPAGSGKGGLPPVGGAGS